MVERGKAHLGLISEHPRQAVVLPLIWHRLRFEDSRSMPIRTFCPLHFRHPLPSALTRRVLFSTNRSFSTTRVVRAVEMETVNTTERLRKLRELMKIHKIDLYIVPSEGKTKLP